MTRHDHIVTLLAHKERIDQALHHLKTADELRKPFLRRAPIYNRNDDAPLIERLIHDDATA